MSPFARIAAVFLLAVTSCQTGPEPASPTDDGTIFTFAPVGPQTFLTEGTPASLHQNLGRLLDDGGPAGATRAYPNRWVQPPGWTARVVAFGEPADGDLYSRQGYPYRTNLVDPDSGVVVLAYTKDRPAETVWEPERTVQVAGRLEGYARSGPGVVILLDAELTPERRS